MPTKSFNLPNAPYTSTKHTSGYEFASADECLYCDETTSSQCHYCAKLTTTDSAGESGRKFRDRSTVDSHHNDTDEPNHEAAGGVFNGQGAAQSEIS